MTAREILDRMTDEQLSQVFKLLYHTFTTHSHFTCLSDDEAAQLSIALFGEDDDEHSAEDD